MTNHDQHTHDDAIGQDAYRERITNANGLSQYAKAVAWELSLQLGRDNLSRTSIKRISRKLDTQPEEIGRAIGQLASKGYVSRTRHPDGIRCTLPTPRLRW